MNLRNDFNYSVLYYAILRMLKKQLKILSRNIHDPWLVFLLVFFLQELLTSID